MPALDSHSGNYRTILKVFFFLEETKLLLKGRLWDKTPGIGQELNIAEEKATVGTITKALMPSGKGVDLLGETKE